MEYLPFEKIVQNKLRGDEKVLYSDELSSLEWKTKRDSIVERDATECKICFNKQSLYLEGKFFRPYSIEEQNEYEKRHKEQLEEAMKTYGLTISEPSKLEKQYHQVFEPIKLHVHHKYYVNGNLAWEYPNEALISLCQNCHQNIHNTSNILVYEDESLVSKMNLTKCGNCNGSGYISKYHYFKEGICFTCNGYKYSELIKR
jgi:5-methylcytosine-specific restriction endonuclease McrA